MFKKKKKKELSIKATGNTTLAQGPAGLRAFPWILPSSKPCLSRRQLPSTMRKSSAQ